MDKFILKIYPTEKINRGEVIRIDSEAIDLVK